MDEVVRTFLTHRYDLHAFVDDDNNTLLHLAINASRWSLAKGLITHGADINTPNRYRTSIHLIVMLVNTEICLPLSM
jgi:ankyrin repeat protein